jgi:hypothetical protein
MTPKYSRKLRVNITVSLGYCCMLSGNLGTAENEWDLTTIATPVTELDLLLRNGTSSLKQLILLRLP